MARRVAPLALALALALSVAATGPVFGGAPAPADYGTENPTGQQDCPPASGLPYDGIEKCFPVGWGLGFVHIVTDPIAANGWVTFWCQSRIGFQYRVGVFDLEPKATYEIWLGPPGHPEHYLLGRILTDPRGNGTVSGVLKFAPGEYYFWTSVKQPGGSILFDSRSDGQGFGVFAG